MFTVSTRYQTNGPGISTSNNAMVYESLQQCADIADFWKWWKNIIPIVCKWIKQIDWVVADSTPQSILISAQNQ